MSSTGLEVSERRGLGANISALAGGQVVTWSMSLAWTLVVSRLLGPAGMGLLVTATSVTAIAGVLLGLGARDFLVREIVANRLDGLRLAGSTIVLRAGLFPFYAAAVVAYGRYAHLSAEARTVLYLEAGATMLILLKEPLQATFQGIERMQYLALGDIFDTTTRSLVGIGLAVLGFGAVGLTAASLVIGGATMTLYVRWIRRQVSIDLRTNFGRIRGLVTGSLPYWAFGVFFMTYLWIDSAMLAAMTRPEVVGWYGVPTKLFTTLMFAPAILSMAWLPRLVSAFEEDRGRLFAVAKAPVELVVVGAAPIAVLAAMLAHSVIPLLFGQGYRNAVPVMVVLGLCLPPTYLNIMLNQVLVAAKRPLVWTWLMAGATAVNPVLNFFLIRFAQNHYHNGAIGAALALLATEVLVLAGGFLMVGRYVLDRSSLWRFARAAAAAAAMGGIIYALRPLGFVIAAAAGGLVYVGLAALLRLASAEEVEMLRAGLHTVRARIRRRTPGREPGG